jgi:hypothetical protein
MTVVLVADVLSLHEIPASVWVVYCVITQVELHVFVLTPDVVTEDPTRNIEVHVNLSWFWIISYRPASVGNLLSLGSEVVVR